MKGLSIIIPCYNSRKTIVKCLESIRTSSLDIEIIVVEDCSALTSEDLINAFARKSNYSVKYIRNELNLGAGRTRNRGISQATKEYITFLDSDDEFDLEYFKLIEQPLIHGYDMVVYDAWQVFSNGNKRVLKMFFSDAVNEGPVDGKRTLVFVKGCTAGKIYRTDIVKKNCVEFGCMKINEDMVFTKTATSFINSVYYVKRPLYIYNDNNQSLMHDMSCKNPENDVYAFNVVQQKLANRGFDKELNSMFYIQVLYLTSIMMMQLGKTKYDVVANYKKYRVFYEPKDPYRCHYSVAYRIPYILFEYRLFGLYFILRNIYKKVRG